MPSALPNRLHDTRLEPTKRAVDLLPVDGVPVSCRVGSRTSRCCHRRHVCVAPLGRLAEVLSGAKTSAKSARLRGKGCCPWRDAPSIPPITEGLWLAP